MELSNTKKRGINALESASDPLVIKSKVETIRAGARVFP